MDEEALNTSVRKFLKKLGVTAQREIEKAVRDAVAKGQLKGNAPLPAKAVVTVGGIDLSVRRPPHQTRLRRPHGRRAYSRPVFLRKRPHFGPVGSGQRWATPGLRTR